MEVLTRRAVVLGALGLAACRPAFGPIIHTDGPATLTLGRETLAPNGWTPHDLKAYPPASRADLTAVHHHVVSYWISQAEPTFRDEWRRGVKVGDCEDFALAVQDKLRLMGVSCRLVFCWIPVGRQRHDAHVVAESQGWVSDIREDTVMPLGALGYHWDKASGYSDAEPWRLVVSK